MNTTSKYILTIFKKSVILKIEKPEFRKIAFTYYVTQFVKLDFFFF